MSSSAVETIYFHFPKPRVESDHVLTKRLITGQSGVANDRDLWFFGAYSGVPGGVLYRLCARDVVVATENLSPAAADAAYAGAGAEAQRNLEERAGRQEAARALRDDARSKATVGWESVLLFFY